MTQWFKPKVHSGWKKSQSQAVRLQHAVKAHHGDVLAAARGLQALANVTTDPGTKRKAQADAKRLFARNRK